MRVIFTKKETITSKSGAKWVKCDFITEDGTTGQTFLAESKFLEYALPESRFQFEKIVGGEESEVDFDQRGRVVGLK